MPAAAGGSAVTHPIAKAERRRILAYGRGYAERVTAAQVCGRLTKADRKLIVRHIGVLLDDVAAGLHREDGDGR